LEGTSYADGEATGLWGDFYTRIHMLYTGGPGLGSTWCDVVPLS